MSKILHDLSIENLLLFILGEAEETIVGTTQSSVYGQFPASKLIDGLGLNGRFNNEAGCAHTNDNSIEWFSLNLTNNTQQTRST